MTSAERWHPEKRDVGPGANRREITRLIDRLRKLVAEQRRLEGRAGGAQLKARRHEIVRLQRQLASVVRRELTN